MSLCSTLSAKLTSLTNLHQKMEKLLIELDEECTDLKLTQAHQLKQQIQHATQELKETMPVSAKEAESILKESFYGPEAIHTAFGFHPSKLANIPYSRETLKQAYKNGERLVLRIATDNTSNPMTMQHMNNLMEPRMDKDTEGKLLWNTGWYQTETFYTTDSLKTEWKLVGGDLLPNSTNKNYIQQIQLLRDHLTSLNALTEEEARSCSDDILKQLSEEMGMNFDTGDIEDGDRYNNDWKKVARTLANLPINQNHRRTPGEMLYDHILHFKTFKDRDYLESNWDWSSCVSSGGSLVGVGGADAGGAHVGGWRPDDRGDGLGVVVVR